MASSILIRILGYREATGKVHFQDKLSLFVTLLCFLTDRNSSLEKCLANRGRRSLTFESCHFSTVLIFRKEIKHLMLDCSIIRHITSRVAHIFRPQNIWTESLPSAGRWHRWKAACCKCRNVIVNYVSTSLGCNTENFYYSQTDASRNDQGHVPSIQNIWNFPL